jgi:hypothetical protein
LFVLHIAVLGYWLGAELVINSTFRYVCRSGDMPFSERDRLMAHVMNVDQHVRYALVLQAVLGTSLASLLGYFPGGRRLLLVALLTGVFWLVFVELVHQLRNGPSGKRLGAIDRGSRYALILAAVLLATGIVGKGWPMPDWLRWKLAFFAGVIACGVGIRRTLVAYFHTWELMRQEGPSAETNAFVKVSYWRATAILILLWVFIAAAVVLSVWKPG